MRRLERAFGGRRAPAVAVMSLGLLAILIVPLGVALQAILAHTDELVALLARLPTMHLPAAPEWLGKVPLAGERNPGDLEPAGQRGHGGPGGAGAAARPRGRGVAAQQAGGFAVVLVQFVLIVVLCAVLYAGGESWAGWLRRFGRKLATSRATGWSCSRRRDSRRGPRRGRDRAGAVGARRHRLAIAGVPFAGVLTAIMFALCIAQLGPILVLLAATAWAYYSLGAGWGTFLLVWALVVGLMDNVLRPLLIKRGADLPLLLIFAGVIGGLVAFGIVAYSWGRWCWRLPTLCSNDWVSADPPDSATAAPTVDGQ